MCARDVDALERMGFLDRLRLGRRGAGDDDSWSEEDIPAFLEAFQPISATSSELPPGLRDEFLAACSAHADLQAVYQFDSDLGGQGERLVTFGLVLDDAADVERLPEISSDLGRHLDAFYGDDYIFQRLWAHSLDRVEGGMSPVYARS
jgi:hypothetical protein